MTMVSSLANTAFSASSSVPDRSSKGFTLLLTVIAAAVLYSPSARVYLLSMLYRVYSSAEFTL